MKHVNPYPVWESEEKSDSRLDRLFDLIEKHTSNWLKEMQRYDSKGKLRDFMEHYSIKEMIQKNPDQMASILYKAMDIKGFADWIDSVKDDLPESFKDSVGVASDMKKLGF